MKFGTIFAIEEKYIYEVTYFRKLDFLQNHLT